MSASPSISQPRAVVIPGTPPLDALLGVPTEARGLVIFAHGSGSGRHSPRNNHVAARLREAGAELYAWLQGGAHLYVCGDAERMAPDVHAALLEIVAHHGGLDPEAAETCLRQLADERRYLRDVY